MLCPLLSRALRIASATFLLLVSESFGTAAHASVEYNFFLIEAFDIDYDLREVNVRDINDVGVVVGTATHNSSYDGFAWTQESDKVIVPLLWPTGLNNLNQIVAGGQIYDFDTAVTINVPAAGGYPLPRLMGINDLGTAVGYSECSCSNSNRMSQTALLWDAQLGSRAISVTSAKELLRVNNANVAVGNIRNGSGTSEGFVYDVATGGHVNLSDLLPPNGFGRAYSELMDVSDNNVAAGRGWDGQNVRGLTWSQANGFTFLGAIPGGLIERVYPRGINASGTVVGFADLTPQSPRAFIWDSQQGMRNLNDLVQAPAGFILDWAVKVNDQGWIIGIGHYGPNWGTSRGFVLGPVDSSPTAVTENIAADVVALRVLPNPVQSRLEVEFSLPAEGSVRISVVDVTGREIARLADQTVAAGTQRISWEPNSGQPSGVYYVRLESSGRVQAERFVLLR